MTQGNTQLRAVNLAPRPGARKGHKIRHHAVASVSPQRPRKPRGKRDAGWTQRLTLMLEGITANDYLAWVRDPEPLPLGMSLRSIAVSAAPIGDRIEVELCWEDTPPPIRSAAIAAGFPLTPEVTPHAAPGAKPGSRTQEGWRPARTTPAPPDRETRATSQPQFNPDNPGPCARRGALHKQGA